MVEEKKLKGMKVPYTQKVAWDMSDLYLNKNSILHCDKCKNRLGVLHTLVHALFKKPGQAYIVVCKECKAPNVRIKGAYKRNVENQWEKLEREMKEKDGDVRPRE